MMTTQDSKQEQSTRSEKRSWLDRLLKRNRADQETEVSASAVPQKTAASLEEDDAMMVAIVGAIAASEEQGAILAAITAAISVVWESEHPGTGFRVVSYRHITKRSPWNA